MVRPKARVRAGAETMVRTKRAGAKVKLLSAWVGPKPPWFSSFQEQMQRFQTVDWELLPPPSVPENQRLQIRWFNQLGTRVLGIPCNKGEEHPEGICEFRPAYGELFADLYHDYDWWGWLDLDMFLGDLDGLLPGLLTDDWDVVTFKNQNFCLSGCLTFLRNKPEVTQLFRKSEIYRAILGDENYHVWDESGYHYYPESNFYRLMVEHGLRVARLPEFYLYDAPGIPQPISFRDGKIFNHNTGQEVLFLHFMSNTWPLKQDGISRWL